MNDLTNIDAQQTDSSFDQSTEAVDPNQNLLDTDGAEVEESPAPSKYY